MVSLSCVGVVVGAAFRLGREDDGTQATARREGEHSKGAGRKKREWDGEKKMSGDSSTCEA